jgi:hypothetical protein
VGIILGAIVQTREWGFGLDTFVGGIIGLLVGFVAALVLWVTLCLFPGSEPATINCTTTKISALADNSRYSKQVSGSVFLVQRRTEEKLKYSYMYECPGKGYGFYEVPAEQCYINYTNEEPRVEIKYIDYQSAFLRYLCPDIYDNEYIFYLPESAEIINDYTIDFN